MSWTGSTPWVGVAAALWACSAPPEPPPTGWCEIDCAEGSRCRGNTVEHSSYRPIRAPSSLCGGGLSFLDACFTPSDTCEEGCRAPSLDDASWCVEDQAPREGDACGRDADCADAAWTRAGNELPRRPTLVCQLPEGLCVEDPSHEWCDHRDDDDDGRVDEDCELHVSASASGLVTRGIALDEGRLLVAGLRDPVWHVLDGMTPDGVYAAEGLECFEMSEGRLHVIRRAAAGPVLEVIPGPSAVSASWQLEGPTRAESIHIDGSWARVVGDDEVVMVDIPTGAVLTRTPLAGLSATRLHTARVGEDLVVCDGARSHWIGPEATVTTSDLACGTAISDRGGLVLRADGRELGRIAPPAAYVALAELPATSDRAARVVQLGDAAIRVTVELEEGLPMLVLARVPPDGTVSVTRRRLDGDARLVDDASGEALAALQLEVDADPEDPDFDESYPTRLVRVE